MASNADVAASEDASASIAYEDDFMVRGGGCMVEKSNSGPCGVEEVGLVGRQRRIDS